MRPSNGPKFQISPLYRLLFSDTEPERGKALTIRQIDASNRIKSAQVYFSLLSGGELNHIQSSYLF